MRNLLNRKILKGKTIEYEERFYFCENADEEENEFVSGAMANDNLKRARENLKKIKNLGGKNGK